MLGGANLVVSTVHLLCDALGENLAQIPFTLSSAISHSFLAKNKTLKFTSTGGIKALDQRVFGVPLTFSFQKVFENRFAV